MPWRSQSLEGGGAPCVVGEECRSMASVIMTTVRGSLSCPRVIMTTVINFH